MIEGLPQKFSNFILSLSFIDVSDLSNRNYIQTNDYVNTLLNHILESKDVYSHCRKIPTFFILKIIILIEYYNNYQYKSELILEKLLYIVFYHIQNRQNIIGLFDNILFKNYYLKLIKVQDELDVIRPNIRNFMNMIIFDIEDYLKESRMYTYQVLDREMTLPHDIIDIIVSYMSNLQILQISEMF